MCLDSSGEELEWTAKKFEKQRSVTFASIDLLEPIEEDFPQVKQVILCQMNFSQKFYVFLFRRVVYDYLNGHILEM